MITEREKRNVNFTILLATIFVANSRYVERTVDCRERGTLTSAAVVPKPFHEVGEFGYERIIAFRCILDGSRTGGIRQRKKGGGGEKTQQAHI